MTSNISKFYISMEFSIYLNIFVSNVVNCTAHKLNCKVNTKTTVQKFDTHLELDTLYNTYIFTQSHGNRIHDVQK